MSGKFANAALHLPKTLACPIANESNGRFYQKNFEVYRLPTVTGKVTQDIRYDDAVKGRMELTRVLEILRNSRALPTQYEAQAIATIIFHAARTMDSMSYMEATVEICDQLAKRLEEFAKPAGNRMTANNGFEIMRKKSTALETKAAAEEATHQEIYQLTQGSLEPFRVLLETLFVNSGRFGKMNEAPAKYIQDALLRVSVSARKFRRSLEESSRGYAAMANSAATEQAVLDAIQRQLSPVFWVEENSGGYFGVGLPQRTDTWFENLVFIMR